jgi:5-methylcytosine-specific restriction endonuclease McrA
MGLTVHRTLLLNAGFEPLRIVSWQRAFTLVFQGKVDVLEEYSATVCSVSCRFNVPAVIRLRRWVNLKRLPPMVRFSRANIYARDEFRCQYCLKEFSERELTLDHVLPAVRGGRKTWENIVAACIRCNQRKSDRTPEEARMPLPRPPRMPQWLPGFVGEVPTSSAPELWERYLAFVLPQKS